MAFKLLNFFLSIIDKYNLNTHMKNEILFLSSIFLNDTIKKWNNIETFVFTLFT